MITPTPFSKEEIAALKSRSPVVSQHDAERLIATIDLLSSELDRRRAAVLRYRKALRACSAVARDGLCFGDGIDFPMQTGIVWDDSDEYL